jgi:hypothetical protein
MAAVKKKKREKSSNPNIVLIIFVVFLFLVSIGFGVWVYYEHDEEKKLRDTTSSAKKALDAEKNAVVFNSMVARELRLAIGDTITDEELAALVVDREDMQKDNFGKFKDEKSKEAIKKLLEELRAKLGADDKSNFKSSYKTELENLSKNLNKVKGELAAALAKSEAMEKISKEYLDRQTKYGDAGQEAIDKGNTDTQKIARQQSKEFIENVEKIRKLNQEIVDLNQDKTRLLEDKAKDIAVLERKIKTMDAERKDAIANAGGGLVPTMQGASSSFSPLLLDLRAGKPLWDLPVGKIMRVDAELRQVVINVGSAQGAKPELTFNVFGTNGAGRAEKQMKGSIEIIRVVDANSSLARITSLYDLDGKEILLNDTSRGRIIRESEGTMVPGELLFNLFWGSHVAVAGYVNITGDPSDNPAEQISQMSDFAHLLIRNGMQVDAFVDLRDGQIRGSISSKTRYLILGDDLRLPANNKAPAMKKDDGDDKNKDKDAKDKDKDAKDKDKDAKDIDAKDKEPKDQPKDMDDANKDQPGGDRAKVFNEATRALMRDASQKGLLLISAEAFSVVTGYRRARSANNPEISGFRPTLPYAGSDISGLMVIRPRAGADADPKAPDNMKEKDMDKEKEKEKEK